MALTDREVRLLRALIAAEEEKAELSKEKWLETRVEDYPEGESSLITEQEFARGFDCGVGTLANVIKEALRDD